MLELAQEEIKITSTEEQQETHQTEIPKRAHIGYYLIDNGINELYKKLEYTNKKEKTSQTKTKIYITTITILSVILSIILSYILNIKTKNIAITIISFILFLIPSSEVIIQIAQTILNKTVKPKLIPKIDFSNGIDKENTTMVVIPTIVKSKEMKREEYLRMINFGALLSNTSNFLYTYILIALLIFAGLYFTVRTRGVQFRLFPEALRVLGELSFREIGALFNKTESWARVTYFRARQQLKEALKR